MNLKHEAHELAARLRHRFPDRSVVAHELAHDWFVIVSGPNYCDVAYDVSDAQRLLDGAATVTGDKLALAVAVDYFMRTGRNLASVVSHGVADDGVLSPDAMHALSYARIYN